MIDPFGRTISYLRVSVTDRCDFRCVYCMAEDMSFPAQGGGAHARGTRAAVQRLHRKGVASASAHRRRAAGPAQCHVACSSGWAASRHRRARRADAHHQRQPARAFAPTWRGRRAPVNVSLDTLDPREIPRHHALGRARPRCWPASTRRRPPAFAVKINTVALKGVNEDEFDRLMLEWCGGAASI
jgi:cyclic pyranopterin phosphate synthase